MQFAREPPLALMSGVHRSLRAKRKERREKAASSSFSPSKEVAPSSTVIPRLVQHFIDNLHSQSTRTTIIIIMSMWFARFLILIIACLSLAHSYPSSMSKHKWVSVRARSTTRRVPPLRLVTRASGVPFVHAIRDLARSIRSR